MYLPQANYRQVLRELVEYSFFNNVFIQILTCIFYCRYQKGAVFHFFLLVCFLFVVVLTFCWLYDIPSDNSFCSKGRNMHFFLSNVLLYHPCYNSTYHPWYWTALIWIDLLIESLSKSFDIKITIKLICALKSELLIFHSSWKTLQSWNPSFKCVFFILHTF